MDRYIVYSKDLTKADTLILKNLEADIKDVLNKPASEAKGTSQAGECHDPAQSLEHLHQSQPFPVRSNILNQINPKMLPSVRRRPCGISQRSRP